MCNEQKQILRDTVKPSSGEILSPSSFIRGKPIRFGFKFWCIISCEKYRLHAEPYCGVDTDLQDTGLGQGADVVLGLIEKCEVKAGSTVSSLTICLPHSHS